VSSSCESAESGVSTFTLVVELSSESRAAAAVLVLKHLDIRLAPRAGSLPMIEVSIRASNLDEAVKYVGERIDQIDPVRRGG
jgi:hypothetical protein